MPLPVVHAAPARCLPDRVDGLFVVVPVACGVCGGERRLAQHVEGIAEALFLARLRVAQRLLDGLAGDELLAHHAHGQVHALANQRFAAQAHQPRHRRRQPRLAVRGHQPARDQQAPGRGVDEQRRAPAQVRLPLSLDDLVADQGVAGGRVGYAQQRLGQAHQGDALLRGQRVLLQQVLHQAGAASARLALAQPLDQLRGQRAGGGGRRLRQARLPQQVGDGLRLRLAPGGGDGVAQRRSAGGRVDEGLEGGGHGGNR